MRLQRNLHNKHFEPNTTVSGVTILYKWSTTFIMNSSDNLPWLAGSLKCHLPSNFICMIILYTYSDWTFDHSTREKDRSLIWCKLHCMWFKLYFFQKHVFGACLSTQVRPPCRKWRSKDKVSANLQLTINSSSLTSISIDSYKLCFENQSCPTCTTQTAQSNKRT
jgi:hypothetical protein